MGQSTLDEIAQAAQQEGRVSRRLFLAHLAALAAVPMLNRYAIGQVTSRPSYPKDPFTLGVASGDPDADGMVLWTKLAPDPQQPDAGMGDRVVDVAWEVAEDEGMKKVVQRGSAVASKELGHSIHAEVKGLAPDRWYWYRFRTGDAESPVGRTRTLPDAAATPDRLQFAVTSCQNYEQGLYTAYEQLNKDDLDLIFQLGDYIYEGAPQDKRVRKHSRTEANGPCTTLTDYRLRYAQYKLDPLLQAAHQKCPWLVTWDDHEVTNNYANDRPGDRKAKPAEFLKRRAAAYQAYYEMLPLRPRSLPKGPDLQLYRSASFGRLAELIVLDTRQYRTAQPNDDKRSPLNAAAMDEKQTIMGEQQKAWLKDRLAASKGTWNVLAQQVMMGMLRRRPDGKPEEEPNFSMDAWTGYAHERMDLVRFLQGRKIANPVVLTGDVHANFAQDLRVDDRETDKPIVAAEFVGTSISSGGDGSDAPANLNQLKADNAHLKYHNRERGYIRCTVTPKLWTSDYVTVPKVTEPGAKAKVRASFVVEAGQPGIKPA